MKKLPIICFIAFLSFLSCSGQAGDDPIINTEIGSLQNLKQNGLKTLYFGNFIIDSQNKSRDVIFSDTFIKTLTYVNENDDFRPITFLTSTDKEVALKIDHILQIGTKRIIIRFTELYEVKKGNDRELKFLSMNSASGQILINLETGKIYDFSKFDTIEHKPNYLVSGNELYVNDPSGTLYKINLNNITAAVPLNNPDHFKFGRLYYKLGNKIITSEGSFDINQDSPPKKILPVLLKDAISYDNTTFPLRRGYGDKEIGETGLSGLIKLGDTDSYMVDNFGNVWIYCFFRFFDLSTGPFKRYFAGRLIINDDGQLGIVNYYEGIITFDYDFDYADKIAIHKLQRGDVTVHLVGGEHHGRILIRPVHDYQGIIVLPLNKSESYDDFKKYYDISSDEFDKTAFDYAIEIMEVVNLNY